MGGPVWKNRLFAFFAYETERNNSSVTENKWYETPDFHKLAPANSIASQFLNFAGSNVNALSVIDETCANAGLVEGTNCHFIPGQGLNLGSPLKLGLGKPDPSYVSTSNPGIGSGLSNVPTIAFYNTTNPTQAVFEQYNGRFDADITQKDMRPSQFIGFHQAQRLTKALTVYIICGTMIKSTTPFLLSITTPFRRAS